jgi:ribosomal-protein-alanine N-acetyltransferase
MVERPPLRYRVRPMTLADVGVVQRIEQDSVRSPLPADAFRQELTTNRLARYLLVEDGGQVVGYAGLWLMVDEAHVTTFAVDPAMRRRGIGEVLLAELMALARRIGASIVTLEVRVSNMPARRLYEKYGFMPVGVRRNYYSDDREDALIMTTPELASREMRTRLAALERSLEVRLQVGSGEERAVS